MKKFELCNWSIETILALKKDTYTDDFFAELKLISTSDIINTVVSDEQKLSFWINVYNASILSLLRATPSLYAKKSPFFDAKHISFSDTVLSLNDIEHGVLRCGRYKYSLGYFDDPFLKRKFRRFSLQNFDARVHFALNCGASSCPPISAYKPNAIHQQLDLAESSFLLGSRFDAEKHTLSVSQVFSWFRGDFGGKRGIIDLHKNHNILPKESAVRLIFERWNWNMNLNKFSEYNP